MGRSNRQNDRLTCKDADRRDIWFHTQKIHGSHVILCTGGTEPDHRSIEEAASLAAYYSQGREGGKVPVDYTPVKFVKKPAGEARHGSLYHLSDDLRRTGRGAGPPPVGEIRQAPEALPPGAYKFLNGRFFPRMT